MTGLVRLLRRRVAGFGTAGSNLLFPPRCASCDADLPRCHDDLLLCDECRILLGPQLWPGCPRCGAITAVADRIVPACKLCRNVQLKFDCVVTLGAYENVLRDVVLKMKRAANEPLSAAMGRLLQIRRGKQIADVRADLVVPVPMHWSRRLTRGTNSPEVLAAALGRTLGLPVRRRMLARLRNTLPQAGLSPRERRRNVRGAFLVRKGYSLRGARVLLVDDVLTTGATCSEAARALKRAGASMVAAVVVARAQGRNAM